MATSGVALPNLQRDYVDQSVAFDEWKDFLQSYFVISGVDTDKQWHYMLLSSGPKGRELWNTWALTADQKKDPNFIFTKFEKHLIGKPNKWVARLELSSVNQSDGEAIDDFICRLKAKAAQCAFAPGQQDEAITFQLIRGISWPDARRTLIAKGNDLKLDDAVKVAQEYQATSKNMQNFRGNTVHALSMGKKECGNCTTTHPPRQCPAYTDTCKACGKKGHWAKKCRGTRSRRNPSPAANRQSRSKSSHRKGRFMSKNRDHKVDELAHNQPAATSNHLDCGELKVDEFSDGNRASIIAKLNMKPHRVERKCTLKVKADTGANANILPMRCLQQMYPTSYMRELTASTTRLTAVNNTTVHHHGYIDLPLQFEKSTWLTQRFYVCDTEGPAILSCDASEKLKIIRVTASKNISTLRGPPTEGSTTTDQPIPDSQTLQQLYPDCFEGIGNMPGQFRIELKDGAEPVVAPPRKYPIQLKAEICEKLSEMEKLGVIIKCNDEVSEWVNSIAFARKSNGDLRVCIDPKFLNQAMKRTYYKTPTLDEISYKLSGAKCSASLTPNMVTGRSLWTKTAASCAVSTAQQGNIVSLDYPSGSESVKTSSNKRWMQY